MEAPKVETHFGLPLDKFMEMSSEHRLEHFAKYIAANGLQRPFWIYKWHLGVFAANYLGYLLLVLLVPRPSDMSAQSYWMLLFVKLIVWQHLAEAIGCRQGPLGMHFALPNNYRYRLSIGTLRYTVLPWFGNKRTLVDLAVNILWFLACAGFLLSPQYELLLIRLLCVCDVWLFCFDLSQFFACCGHAYGTMLLAACVPVESGRIAGIQLGLIIQWFFSGIGKVGPWFTYVNGPFMLQSNFLAGRAWLRKLLIRAEDDLGPTLFGKCLAHLAAAMEYLGPLALMVPAHSAIWFGLVALTAMHFYILVMPAPFDVYSWNFCFGLSGIYLFYINSFGFDYAGAAGMSPWLAAFICAEVAACWYGQFFPDKIGYYLSHRYWAGNWVQAFFFVRKTEANKQKLDKVKTFSGNPLAGGPPPYFFACLGYLNMAYLWLSNLNVKCLGPLSTAAIRSIDGPSANLDDWAFTTVQSFGCGEFRDQLYALPMLPAIQNEVGFEAGECFMVRIGSIGMCRSSATWGIYDLKNGVVREGVITREQLMQIDALPSKSTELRVFD